MEIMTKRIADLSQNGVVPLKKIKETNFYLYKYYELNKSKMNEILALYYNVAVMNDIFIRKDKEYIRLYLTYHYGKKINVSKFAKEHFSIYRTVCEFGDVPTFLNSLGFEVKYAKKDKFIEKLEKRVNKKGYIVPPYPSEDQRLYDALYKRAKRSGMNIPQYLKSLGFTVKSRTS